MKTLIIIFFVSIFIFSAKSQNTKNFFVQKKLEPIIGLSSSFNGHGNSTEGFIGLNYDRFFNISLGGLILTHYQFTGQTTAKAFFVKEFVDLVSLSNEDSRFIIGPSIALGLMKVTQISDEKVSSSTDWELKIIPGIEVAYKIAWAKIAFVSKYISYENLGKEKRNNFYYGLSYTMPISIEMNKNHFR